MAQWVKSQLLSRGISVQTTAFSYNLATLTLHVEGLVAATAADLSHPFLEAARIDVGLPRSILSGRLAVSSLSADGVRVTLVRRRDGSTNFPQSSGSGSTSTPAPFPMNDVSLSNVSVVWRDEVLDMSAEAEQLSLSLRPGSGASSGALTLGRPATLRAGGRTTAIAADARLAWNGSTLSIESVRLSAPEGTVSAAGSLGLLVDSVPLTIDASGEAQVGNLAAWLDLAERPAGRIGFRTHVTGSVADPRAEVTVTSQNLGWQGLTNVSADATAHLDRSALEIESVNVRLLGGTASARGRLSLSPVAPGADRARLSLDWRGVDSSALLRAVRVKVPVELSAQLDGHATASWTAWTIEGLSGEVTASSRSMPGNAHTLGLTGTMTLGTRAGQWHGTIDQWLDRAVHLEGRADGRLTPASLAASTIAATLVATADSWPTVWRTMHELDLGPGSAPGTLAGGGRAELTLSGRVDNPGLAGRVDATLPDLAQLAVFAPANLRPSGRLSVSGVVSGSAKAPVIDGRLVGEALSVAGQNADRLDASFGVAANIVRIESLSLTSGGWDADRQRTVRHGYGRSRRAPDSQRADGQSRARFIARRDPRADRRQNSAASGRREGTIANLRGAGHVELDETKLFDRESGSRHVAAGIGRRSTERHDRSDRSVHDRHGDARHFVGCPGGRDADTGRGPCDAGVTAGNRDGPRVTGAVSFAAHVEGNRQDLAHLSATVDLRRLDAAVGDVSVSSTQPGRASYDGRAVDLSDLALNIGRSQLRAAGRLGDPPGTLDASLDGEAGDIEQLAAAFLPAGISASRVRVDGRVHLDIHARGSLDRPALSAVASLDEGRVAMVDQPQASSIVARASYETGVLTLSRFDASWQDATVSATGEVPIALVVPSAPALADGRAAHTTCPGPIAGADRLDHARRAGAVRAGRDAVAAVRPRFGHTDARRRSSVAFGRSRSSSSSIEPIWLSPACRSSSNSRRGSTSPAAARRLRVELGRRRQSFVAQRRCAVRGSVQHSTSRRTARSICACSARFCLAPPLAARACSRPTPRVRWRIPQLDGRIDLAGGRMAQRIAPSGDYRSDGQSRVVQRRADRDRRRGSGQRRNRVVAGTLKHAGLRLTSGRLAITGRGLAMAIPEALKTEVDLDADARRGPRRPLAHGGCDGPRRLVSRADLRRVGFAAGVGVASRRRPARRAIGRRRASRSTSA